MVECWLGSHEVANMTDVVCVLAEVGGPAPILECLFSRVPQVLCEPNTLCLLCSGFVPVQCSTVEVCVIFLDTLTPEFELYVRLRERRQRAATCVELVLLLVACSVLVVGGLAVCLACSGVGADLYQQQLSSCRVQCELCSLGVCPR
ncbi:hypothetical protein Taro_025059 [Colocasia esculenta]|uniref:Uncharacterized protein n=1 Tax=Colocasia esculenta TaxID=4460 RepID=A0A843V7W7_COLES|nr:hypothetical protein [Colocasia esculenta]